MRPYHSDRDGNYKDQEVRGSMTKDLALDQGKWTDLHHGKRQTQR